MTNPAARRYHSLDALRAAMMLLGIVLHSAASYVAGPMGAAWPYKDAQTSGVFNLTVFFIHIFRMPVFFVAAGFSRAMEPANRRRVRDARDHDARRARHGGDDRGHPGADGRTGTGHVVRAVAADPHPRRGARGCDGVRSANPTCSGSDPGDESIYRPDLVGTIDLQIYRPDPVGTIDLQT